MNWFGTKVDLIGSADGQTTIRLEVTTSGITRLFDVAAFSGSPMMRDEHEFEELVDWIAQVARKGMDQQIKEAYTHGRDAGYDAGYDAGLLKAKEEDDPPADLLGPEPEHYGWGVLDSEDRPVVYPSRNVADLVANRSDVDYRVVELLWREVGP